MCESDKSEAAVGRVMNEAAYYTRSCGFIFIISLRGMYFGDNPLSLPFLEPVRTSFPTGTVRNDACADRFGLE